MWTLGQNKGRKSHALDTTLGGGTNELFANCRFSATGKVLASELPKNSSTKCTVLYPASAKASNEIGLCCFLVICFPYRSF